MIRCRKTKNSNVIVLALILPFLSLLSPGCAEDTGEVAGEPKSPFDGGFVGNQPDTKATDSTDGSENPPGPIDKTGPTLTLVAPLVDVPVSLSVTVHVVAEDPSGVADILVAVDVDPLTDTHPDPAVFMGTWKTSIYANGPHKLLLRGTDALGNESWTTIPIEVKNDKGSLVFGTASVGTPVRKATVTVHEFSNKGPGKTLGTNKTDEDGKFSVVTGFDSTTGWALVTVSGPAFYDHPETGETLQMTSEDKLTSVIELPPGGAADTQLNLWTTISTRLMNGLYGQGVSFANQWTIATQWISDHLWRPESFAVDQVAPYYLENMTSTDELSPGVITTLTQMALWRVAEEEQSTIFDAARKLGADLATDASFDGDGRYEGAPSWSPLLWNSGIQLTTEDTRYRLAQTVAELVLDLEAEQPTWPEQARYDALNAPGGLLDTLAHDDGPLYPPVDKAPVYYFDHDPPVITFVDPTPQEGAWLGNNHILTFVAIAQDKSPLQQFYLEIEPQQSLKEHWKIKWDNLMLGGEIPATELGDGVTTLTVTAVDTAKVQKVTSISRGFSIDLTPPKFLTITPADDPPISATSVEVQATVEDTGSGVAKVTATPQNCEFCTPTAFIYDEITTNWKGTVGLEVEGPQLFVINAVDNAGNISVQAHTLVRDTVPPTMVAVKSTYVRAAGLALTSSTTAEQPDWQSGNEPVNLTKDCNLTDSSDDSHICASPLSIFVHDATCTETSPRLLFDVNDTHLTTLIGEFDYGHISDNNYQSLTKGTLPIKKGVFEIPLCTDTLGDYFQAPNVTHRITVWAKDSAGNSSKPITVEFTVVWETPPLWIGPSTTPVDSWDLASYSFNDFSIHVPFGMAKVGGIQQNTYRVFRYDIINPHPIPINVSITHLASISLSRLVRHAYLYNKGWKLAEESMACKIGECSYLMIALPPEWQTPFLSCTPQTAFESLTVQDTDITVWTYIESNSKEWIKVNKGDTFTIPPNSSRMLSWRMLSADTCAVSPPYVHTAIVGETQKKWTFYTPPPPESCLTLAQKLGGAATLPYPTDGLQESAGCVAGQSDGKKQGAAFLLPITTVGLRTEVHAAKVAQAALVGVNYAAQSGVPKTFIEYAKDSTLNEWLQKGWLQLPQEPTY